MSYCERCGSQLIFSGFNYCPSCGSYLGTAYPAGAQNVWSNVEQYDAPISIVYPAGVQIPAGVCIHCSGTLIQTDPYTYYCPNCGNYQSTY